MKHLRTHFFIGMLFTSATAIAHLDEDTRQGILRDCFEQSKASENEYFENPDVVMLNSGDHIYDSVMRKCVADALEEHGKAK